MRQLLLSATLLLCSYLGLQRAEAQEYRYEFGASLASNYYIGDLGRQGIIAPQSLGIALELRRVLSLRWTLSSELALRGLRGSGTFASNTYPSDGRTLSFSRTLTDIALGGEFHFFPYSDREHYLGTRSWTPFIGAGLGLAGGVSDSKLQLIPGVYARLGMKYRLSPRWALSASWTLRRTFTDHLEGLGPASWMANPFGLDQRGSIKHHDSYGYWSIGLHYSLAPRQRYSCN